MNGKELQNKLLTTLCGLLDNRETLKGQLTQAQNLIEVSFEKSKQDNIQPMSIEQDAVWYKYLLRSLQQAEQDIALVLKALRELGVSVLDGVGSYYRQFKDYFRKNQGYFALDFSVVEEKA